jgi:hypothetical protein
VDAPPRLALRQIAGREGGSQSGLFVQTEIGLAMSRIGAVAMEAGLREDRPHVATELRRRGFNPVVRTDGDTEPDGERDSY